MNGTRKQGLDPSVLYHDLCACARQKNELSDNKTVIFNEFALSDIRKLYTKKRRVLNERTRR